MTLIPIVYVMPQLHQEAGTERHILEVLTHLDRRAFSPILCCFRAREPLEYARKLGVPIIDGRVESFRGAGIPRANALLQGHGRQPAHGPHRRRWQPRGRRGERAGLPVPPRNPDRQADAVLTLLGDPQRAAGAAARARIEAHYSVQAMLRQLYRRELTRKGAPGA